MVDNLLRRRPLGPVTAAVLSFVWPGLGQLATGRRRFAAILAIPAAVLVLAILSRLVGRLELAAVTMLDPGFAGFVFFAAVALAGWRSIAVIDAWRSEVPMPANLRARQWLAGLLIAIALSHALVGYYAWAFYDAGSQIFIGDGPSPSPPAPTPTLEPGETPAPPTPTPGPTAPPSDRISILLTGIDSGHDRRHALTDTMLVMSVSPSKGTVSMISFPRDLAQFQLYSGGTFNDKLNALRSIAAQNPSRFPDGPDQTLANQLGFFLGIRIQYTAAINLVGFERMINLVGGIDIVNERSINDPTYDWFDGTYGFHLSAGKHHLDGRNALAYVRSRKGSGDNDFTRANRQQQLILALKDKLASPATLAKLPQLLEAAGKTIKTNVPPEEAHDYIELADLIDPANITRVVLGPPYAFHPPTSSTGGTYILQLNEEKVAALAVELFGTDTRYFGAVVSPSPTR
jgi:LCP family protein required for cell wall assembly